MTDCAETIVSSRLVIGRLWDDTVSNRSIDKDEDQTGEEVQWNLMLVTVTVTMIAVAAIDTFVSKNAMLSPA